MASCVFWGGENTSGRKSCWAASIFVSSSFLLFFLIIFICLVSAPPAAYSAGAQSIILHLISSTSISRIPHFISMRDYHTLFIATHTSSSASFISIVRKLYGPVAPSALPVYISSQPFLLPSLEFCWNLFVFFSFFLHSALLVSCILIPHLMSIYIFDIHRNT